MASVEAQNSFGELIDAAQREPTTMTRRGRAVANYFVESDKKLTKAADSLALEAIKQTVNELR